MRKLLAAGFLAAALALPAQAGDEVFVVPRTPVQAQAESPSAAKTTAQTQGRRRAMDILLRRVTVEEDWIYLPRLAQGEPAPAAEGGAEAEPVSGEFDPYRSPAAGGPGAWAAAEGVKSPISLTDRDLEALESSFEVYDERSSATSYRALISYRFKPDAVRRLLKTARLPYSETQTRTALVMPVLQTDAGVYLWEPNNPWMAAWKARPFDHELTPLSAPLGDLEDSSTISAREALALNEEKLAALAERYSVSQIVVAHARLRQQDGQDQLSVRLINGYRESAADTALDDFDPELMDDTDGASVFSPSTPTVEDRSATRTGDVLGQTQIAQSSGDFPALAERAIEAAIANYAKDWKERTLIDHSSEAVFETTAFFSSLSDWTKIRSGLVSTPLVGSVQVYALSPRGAEMRLRVFGDPARLEAALDNYGVEFWTEGADQWFLATPSMARRLRGSRALQPRRERNQFGARNDELRYDAAFEEGEAPPATRIEQRY